MKIFNHIQWLIVLIVFGTFACTQQDKTVAPATVNTPITNKAEIRTELDQNRADFAKALAQSFNSSNVREFIKNEASKQFDGDFDILYGKTKDAKIGGKTLEEAVAKYLVPKGSRVDKKAFLADIVSKDPLLNIGVPVNIDNWNTANYKPLVAVLTEEYDDQKTSHILAYDSEGNEHWIDAKNRPENTVVVVGWNERLKTLEQYNQHMSTRRLVGLCDDQMQRQAPYYTAPGNQNAFYLIDDPCTDDGGPGDGGTGGGGTGGGSTGGGGTGGSGTLGTDDDCYRENNSYERLKAMYFTASGLNYYEGWPAGAPEVDLRVYTPDKDRNYTEAKRMRFIDNLEPRKRKDIKDKWWEAGNLSLLYWDEDVHGTVIYLHFVEDDYQPGVSVKSISIKPKFKVTLPIIGETEVSLDIKIEINSKDEDMGGMTVDKCATPPDYRGRSCYSLNQYFSFELSH